MTSQSGVNRAHAVPLYHQIFLMLRDKIVSGERPFGAPMPTEHELSERHDVSRITARRALAELSNQGYVARRRRTGTTVIYRSRAGSIEADIDQAVESLLAFGRDTVVRVLALSTCRCDGAIAARLGIAQGDRVERAVRLRLLDSEPLGEVVSYVPKNLNLRLSRKALKRTPMLALLHAAGHPIGAGRQSIAADLADQHLSELLGIEVRAPILKIERTVLDRMGRPLLFTVASYRADRYRLSINLSANSSTSDRRG